MSLKDLYRRLFLNVSSFKHLPPPQSVNPQRTLLGADMFLEDRTVPTTVTLALSGDMVEGGATMDAHLTRDNTSGPLSLFFSFTGTAMATDYTVSPMMPSFSDGQSAIDVTFTATNNSSATGTLTLGVTLPGGGYTPGTPNGGTINIYDDDNPQVTVAVQGGNPTEGGTSHFRISRTGSTSGNLTVNYTVSGTATSGTDYTSIGTSATITSGNSYVDVAVATAADNAVEGGETVVMNITDPASSSYTANNATATMTITDDPPVVSIAATDTTEGSNGKFRISRTGGNTTASLGVTYTVTGGTADSGDDFTALSGSATIGAGNSYVDVTLAALVDNLVEGDETVEVTISSGGSGYSIDAGVATATIADDPPVLSVTRYADGTEGGSNGSFRVSRTGGDISASIIATYTMSGTATSGSDYSTPSGTVTIGAGNTYASVTITVTNDGTAEDAETVILTLDSSDDYDLGVDHDTLFVWDNDNTGFEWTGASSVAWLDPDNWLVGGSIPVDPPGASDEVFFDNTHSTGDATLSGPIIGGYAVKAMHLAASYSYTVTLSFPLSVNSLDMQGGTIDQPSSGYGSDLTITNAASWLGGVLNSTANAASVIFDGATVAIQAAADLTSGSEFQFVSAEAVLVPPAAGNITFNNGEGVIITGSSYIGLGVAGPVGGVISANVTVNGGTVNIVGGTTLNSLYVLNGGSASISGGNKVSFTGNVPGWEDTAVLVIGGNLNIQNGTTLNAGSNDVYVSGWDGTTPYAGALNTYASGNKSQTTASITAAKLKVGTGAGTVSVTIAKDSLAAGDHVFSVLNVSCPVDWERGVYVPTVGEPGVRDRWVSTGVITVKGSTTSIAPITATGATESTDYPVLQSDGKFAGWANDNGVLPTLADGWSYKAMTGFGQDNWQIKFTV